MDNLDPLLQPKSEPFTLRGKEYLANFFTVAQEEEIYDVLDVISEVIARVPDAATSTYILMRYAFRETCILVKHGTNMTADEIVSLDRDAFMLVLGKVLEVNKAFFYQAALENASLQVAAK